MTDRLTHSRSLNRSLRFAAPSAAAALIAASAAGAIEGLRHAALLPALLGAGFAAIYAAPLALVVALGGRALWQAWRPAWTPRDGEDPAEVAARLAGGLAYAALAIVALAGAAYLGVRLGAGLTKVPSLVALFAAALVGVAAVVVLAISRPLVRGVAALVRRLPITTRRVATVALIKLGVVALVGWLLVVRPALATVDYGLIGYLAPYLALIVVVHLAWARWPRVRVALGGVAVLLGGVGFAVAGWARGARPAAVIEAWATVPVGGLAIERTLDVHGLRGAVSGVTPIAHSDVHPDVVLITIDTVRADRLALFGGPAETPNLDRFAAGAAIFERAYAPSNATRRSVPSIVTGLSPPRLRGRVVGWALKLDPRHILLAERFAAAGYQTAGFFCCSKIFAGPDDVGLDRGLDVVGFRRDALGLDRMAGRWLDRAGDAPRFLWVHYYEPHVWASTYPDSSGEDHARRYDRSLADLDRGLAALFEALEATGRPMIIAITSDHGEGLGDHKQVHHNSDLFDTQLHVPLLVRGPDIPARRIAAATGLVDLSPTLLDLAGFTPPGMPAMDGVSLAATLRAATPPGVDDGEAFAAMIADRSVKTSAGALIAGRYKLIVFDGRAPQLYDTVADPGELADLAAAQPERVEALRARLEARSITAPPF